ncbi:MAG: YfgM family protein [Verrucomicrobiales bacterium]
MTDPTPAESKLAATPDVPPEARIEWQQSGFEQFLERHFKKLLIVLALIAAGTAVFLVYRQHQGEQRLREAQAFTSATTIEDYKKFIANYPGSVAAGSARFMVANLLAEAGSVNEAVEELDRFLLEHADHPLRDHAAFRVAVLTMEKGDAKAGLEKLEAFIRGYPESELAPLARLRQGDAFALSGQPEEARKVYEQLIADKSFAGNPFFKEAENRLAEVKLKPPVEVEFVPEPEPKAGDAPPGGSPGAPTEINAPSFSLDGGKPGPLEPGGSLLEGLGPILPALEQVPIPPETKLPPAPDLPPPDAIPPANPAASPSSPPVTPDRRPSTPSAPPKQ